MQYELTHLLEALPGLGWTALADGRAEFFNQRWFDYTGLTARQAQDLGWVEAVHPHDRQGLLGYWRSCLASGTAGDSEARMRRSDGAYRWFLFRANPVRDPSGNISRWVGTHIDVEDRRRSEDRPRASEALRSTERNLNLIINTIPAHIYVLNTTGSVQYVNRAVMDYTGLSMEDVQQVDYRDRVIHPEDLRRVRPERDAGLKNPAPFETEQRVLRKDGQYRWFLVHYNPLLDEQGRIQRWYVAAFDIEDRKRAEAQLEQAYLRLVEAQRLSKTGSFISDVLADEHQWSEEAFRIFEIDPTTRITVQMVRKSVHPEDLPAFDSVIAKGMTGDEVDFSYRILTSRGAVKHVRGKGRIMEQLVGRPLFIGAVQDVTESLAAEEVLNRARSELAQVSRVTTLNTWTASIAHEVNQPLSGIITNADTCLMMLDTDPPNVEGAREPVRRILRDGQRAADVISRLRTLYSRKEFTPEPLDLNEATREVIALSQSDLRANRVILRSDLADALPCVTGDRVQLQQVILNLVRNASDAMTGVEDRPRDLLVRTERDANDRVRVSIMDAGVGFRPEVAEKLFDAFYTTKNDGMGIGLSVSRSIIDAHHGQLWATANEGPGATFCFSIPCHSASTRAAHDLAPREKGGAANV